MFKLRQVLNMTFPSANSLQDIEHPARAYTAKSAFATGLVLCELEEIPRDVDHAGGVIQNNKSPRTHDGADVPQRFVIDRRVRQTRRHTASRRSANLDRLEAATSGNST